METMKAKTVQNEGLIKGKWQLTYKLVNNLGKEGFSGKLISSYTDPFNSTARHLFSPDGNFMSGYFIDRTVKILNPESEPWHATLIDWLLGHPEVGIDNNQVKLDSKYIAKKISNPRIKLVNLDHQDVTDLDEEDYIDKLIGKLSLEGGPQSISLEKFRFILSKLGLEYRIEKYITVPKVEKQKLRKKLKDFARSSKEAAEKIYAVIENLEEAKYQYEIKEMVRLGLISNNNGMFTCKGNPIGISTESIIKYFINTPDFYAMLKEELYTALK